METQTLTSHLSQSLYCSLLCCVTFGELLNLSEHWILQRGEMRSRVPLPGLRGGLFRTTEARPRSGRQKALSKGRYYLTTATIRIIITGES